MGAVPRFRWGKLCGFGAGGHGFPGVSAGPAFGGAGITPAAIALRPGAQVRRTVRGSGAPLGDALVALVDAAGNVVATATTGLDGAYYFSDLDSGAYELAHAPE